MGETATLGAGCFWCVEAIFQSLKGVDSVVSGYAGGTVEHPTYQQVCGGNTGHAEAIQLTFDPEIISYEDVLYVFWRTHDPTTLNRQGHDVGTAYRSVIFYHDDTQNQIAETSRETTQASGLWPNPIITEITEFTNFYPAEGYHQNYYRLNPQRPYCRAIIDPKMQKFKTDFQDRLNLP